MGSPNNSFKGWELLQFLKGRRKLLITIVGAGIAYFISDSATVAIVSGAAVEMALALGEYYIKQY